MPNDKTAIKTVLLGPAKAGKTCFVEVVNGSLKNDGQVYYPSIGCDYVAVNNELFGCVFKVWAMPAIDQNTAIYHPFMRKAELICVFCDLTNPNSLKIIGEDYKVSSLKADTGNNDARAILIGTLPSVDSKPKITIEEFKKFSRQMGFDQVTTCVITDSAQIQKVFANEARIFAEKKGSPLAKLNLLAGLVQDYKNKRNDPKLGEYYYGCAGHLFRLGISRTKKIAAADALITAINAIKAGEANVAIAAEFMPALKQGELGKLYTKYLHICQSMSKDVEDSVASTPDFNIK